MALTMASADDEPWLITHTPSTPEEHGPAGAVRVEGGGERQEVRHEGVGCFLQLGLPHDAHERADEEPHRPLEGLQGHVASKTVGDDHVG